MGRLGNLRAPSGLRLSTRRNDRHAGACRRQFSGATITRDTLQVCGQKAYRLIATGLAAAPPRKNIVVVAFRSGDALVTQQYAFSQPQPAADAVTTLESLCPQAP